MAVEMSRFDKILTFKHNDVPYFLFRALNVGKQTDELKFFFLARDPKFSRGVISMKKPLKMGTDDVVSDYSEISYHGDGLVLFKYPRYEIESMQYHNPKGPDNRKTKLSDIKEWEPFAIYSIFSYRGHEVSKDYVVQKSKKIHEIKNSTVLNGRPLRCLINLVHKSYTIPDFNNPNEINIRIPGITANLDLWIIAANIQEEGYYLEVDGMENPIFSNNSRIQIAEKKP